MESILNRLVLLQICHFITEYKWFYFILTLYCQDTRNVLELLFHSNSIKRTKSEKKNSKEENPYIFRGSISKFYFIRNDINLIKQDA